MPRTRGTVKGYKQKNRPRVSSGPAGVLLSLGYLDHVAEMVDADLVATDAERLTRLVGDDLAEAGVAVTLVERPQEVLCAARPAEEVLRDAWTGDGAEADRAMLRLLQQGLDQGRPIELAGDRATMTYGTTQHVARLVREDGLWRVEDLD